MDDLTKESLSIPIILEHLERNRARVNVYGKFGINLNKNKIQFAVYNVFIKKHYDGSYHCYTIDAFDNLFVLSFFPSNVYYISRIKVGNGCFDIELVEDLDKGIG